MKKRVAYFEIVDDFDGTPADQTVTFSLEGVRYEIDLSAENLNEMREIAAPYIARARRIGGSKKKPRAKALSQRAAPKVVRAWAVEQGIEVNPTGRIPQAVVEQYDAAQR